MTPSDVPEEGSNAQDIPAASNVTYEHPTINYGSLLQPSDNHEKTNSDVSTRKDEGGQESDSHNVDGYDETGDDQNVAHHYLLDQGSDSSDGEWEDVDSTTCSHEESVVEFDVDLLDSRYRNNRNCMIEHELESEEEDSQNNGRTEEHASFVAEKQPRSDDITQEKDTALPTEKFPTAPSDSGKNF